MIGGLDIGTTNCKLSIYNSGELLVQTSASYAATRASGRHTLDANAVWAAVKSLFHQAIATEPRAAQLKALAVSALGEAAVPVDGNGNTKGDALLFWDASGKEELAGIFGRVGKDAIQRITGLVPDPMYTLCKMAWQKTHNPQFREIKHFLMFEDFIIYRLTGERLVSYSLACRTMALDIRSRAWSRTMFDAAGIDMDWMSRPAPSGTVAGVVMAGVRRELGLTEETIVTTGGHDQMCVALGAGAVRDGVASNGSGTVEVMALTLPPGVESGSLLADNYTLSIHADPDAYFTYSCNSTGSLLLSWYLRTFASNGAEEPFAEFEALAPQTPTSLLALPYIAGSGTPFMDLGVTGGIIGITHETTKYDIYRALMEGLTFDLAHNLELMRRDGVDAKELRATGGGSLSRLWLQIKADVTGLPVCSLRSHQAGALGCMMLASIAAGVYGNVYEAVDALVKVGDVFEPDKTNHAFYAEQAERFMTLFSCSRDIVRQ